MYIYICIYKYIYIYIYIYTIKYLFRRFMHVGYTCNQFNWINHSNSTIQIDWQETIQSSESHHLVHVLWNLGVGSQFCENARALPWGPIARWLKAWSDRTDSVQTIKLVRIFRSNCFDRMDLIRYEYCRLNCVTHNINKQPKYTNTNIWNTVSI